jgi:hypothetical protein
MAKLDYQPDYTDTKEQSFEPIPAGDYIAVIENSDYLQNKQGSGNILKLTYQIIDGPMKGKKLFENLNLENANQQAEQISRRVLNALCLACNLQDSVLKDSAQLHNIPIKISVGVRPDGRPGMEGQIQNTIKKHLLLKEEQKQEVTEEAPVEKPKTSAKKTAAAPAAEPTAKKKHPWER